MTRVEEFLNFSPNLIKTPSYIKNLPLITLLNVDYKLFTKVLADHVKQVLPSLIHTDQNGFVKNRFLGNNVLDVYSLIALAEESEDDNYVLLLLDREKAFDNVNWDFLHTTLMGGGVWFPRRIHKLGGSHSTRGLCSNIKQWIFIRLY